MKARLAAKGPDTFFSPIMPAGVNFTTLATGALGFTIALAWNDAIGKTVRAALPAQNDREAAQVALVYALLITLLVILVVAVTNHARHLAHLYAGPAGFTRARSAENDYPSLSGAVAAVTGAAYGAAHGAAHGAAQGAVHGASLAGHGGALVHLWEPPA